MKRSEMKWHWMAFGMAFWMELHRSKKIALLFEMGGRIDDWVVFTRLRLIPGSVCCGRVVVDRFAFGSGSESEMKCDTCGWKAAVVAMACSL